MLDIVSNVDMDFWGYREYAGVHFYIEPETNLSELCPFNKPKNSPCPHRGLCRENYRKWKHLVFLPENEVDFMEIIPKSLEVRQDLTYLNASWMPDTRRFRKMLTLTNAVPLIIYGLKLRHDYSMFFDLARSSLIRPVFIIGASNIPVPQDFKGDICYE